MAALSSSDAKSQVIILTGPVGSGKSSLLNYILQLCSSASEEPDWTAIVNDTGRTGVLANTGTGAANNEHIRTVYGACEMSAKTGVPLRTAVLRALLPPRRLFIELSTLAQPMMLRALLDNANAVASTQVVALVPLAQHLDLWRLSVTYRSQLEQADVLALRLSDSNLEINKQGKALSAIEQHLADKQIILWSFECSIVYEAVSKGNGASCSKVYSLEQVASMLLATQSGSD